jgi:hypothetical protein
MFVDFMKSADPGKESTLSLIRNDFTIKIKKKTGFHNHLVLTSSNIALFKKAKFLKQK